MPLAGRFSLRGLVRTKSQASSTENGADAAMLKPVCPVKYQWCRGSAMSIAYLLVNLGPGVLALAAWAPFGALDDGWCDGPEKQGFVLGGASPASPAGALRRFNPRFGAFACKADCARRRKPLDSRSP